MASDILQEANASADSPQVGIVSPQEANHSQQEAPKPCPPTYSENDRPLLASEIKQKLLECGLIRKPPPEAVPTGKIVTTECYLNELPIELRQQILLTYITSPPHKVETWRARFYAGRDEEEALVAVPCKINWWLRGLRVLNLMATCKSWRPELVYVVEHLENQVKDEYDHELDRANSGLKGLRGRTTASSESTMRAYLREYRKSLQGSMLHTLWRLKQELSVWVYFREYLVSDGETDDLTLWEYHLRDLREIACLQHKKKEEQDDLWQDLLVECRKVYLGSD